MPVKAPPPEVDEDIEATRPGRYFDGRHRGGAWKVAYADFVTALMALFIVLWMMSASTAVKKSISGYFQDPRGYSRKLGGGPAGSGEGLLVHEKNVDDLRKDISAALHRMPEFQKVRNNVVFSATGEGLRIELLETEKGMFFVSGGSAPTPAGVHLLALLAAQIAKMPNQVIIEGHTDAQPFRNARVSSVFGNWELSADRANAARRLLTANGVPSQQIVEVRGFADRRLLKPDPNDPRNRRVSVVVKFDDNGK